MKKVSFDFDDTLSKQSIQKYALNLIEKGIDIRITTRRYDFDNIHLYDDMIKHRINIEGGPHKDLLKVLEFLNLDLSKVTFTNGELKWQYFNNNSDFIWHLDDDPIELNKINSLTKIKGISCLGSNYIYKCNKLLI